MAKIHICELSDAIPQLPDVGVFDPKSTSLCSYGELFLCALGFEQRCLTLPRQLAEAGWRFGESRYIQYSTNKDDNDVNRPELESCLGRMSENAHPLQGDEPEFTTRLRELVERLEPPREGALPRVTFDISVAANRMIMKCMKVLLHSNISLRIVYSEAAIYHPTRDEYDRDRARWKTEAQVGPEQGVSDVSLSNDYPGHQLDPLPDCIILFPSFKAERSRAVIGKVDMSLLVAPGKKVYWLVGAPHLENDSWRMEAMREINGLRAEHLQFEVKTFDYKDTLQTLEKIHAIVWSTSNISLSPMGSKLQAVGTSLFCFLHPEVRVWLATPKKYNASQYSEGCKATWAVNFGPTSALRKLLERVGSLEVAG